MEMVISSDQSCMMKSLVLALFVFVGVVSLSASEKPNVLFVISDDLSYNLSGMGHEVCKTPHLDEFAKSSVAFTRAYTQFPLCAPSRASLFSGQYPCEKRSDEKTAVILRWTASLCRGIFGTTVTGRQESARFITWGFQWTCFKEPTEAITSLRGTNGTTSWLWSR